jgi:predicted PurR-regulated permease PerM
MARPAGKHRGVTSPPPSPRAGAGAIAGTGRPDESVARRALPLYVALVGALLTAVAVLAVLRLTHLLLIVFVSMLLAAAMSDPVDFLERFRIPRLVSATLIQLAVVAGVAVGLWFMVPPLADQVTAAADSIPERVQQYEGLQKAYDDLRADYPALESLDEQAASVGERIVSGIGERLVDLPLRLGRLMLDLLAISVISALLVARRERLVRFGLSLMHPRHRDDAERVADKMWDRLGRYVRAKLIVMAIIGAITYVTLLVIDVRYPLLLAVVVAFGEAIPQIGPWIARVPLFAIAALDGGTTLILAIIASVVIENLKGYLISPWVEGDQLDIDPLVVILSVLAGGALLGPIGALVAVPAAACVQVLCEEVLIPWRRGKLERADQPVSP